VLLHYDYVDMKACEWPIASPTGQKPADSAFARMLVRYLKTARPIQLIKTVLGVGWGQYCANANHLVLRSDSIFAILGMVTLWAGLYGLNDIADVRCDANTIHKRFRPLAAGDVRAPDLFCVSAFQIAAALLLLSASGISVALIGVALVINQFIYSFEPLRLKRCFLLDVISAAVFSHGARFAVGLQSAPGRQAIGFAGGALILWKVAAYLAYRLEDAPGGKTGRTGTVAYLADRTTLAISALAMIASFVCIRVYWVRTNMPAGVALSLTLLYVVAVSVCITLFRRASCPRALEMLVFSATGRAPAGSKATSA
jgi:4-hydroxybenzoate polyprenyltransferase